MDDKQGNYSFSPVLFTDEAGNSLVFVIKPCKYKEILRDMIKCGGGEVVATPGDHGITLIPPEVEVGGDDEVYSAKYITDCCKRDQLQDLKQYRLNAASRFPSTFDVMDVLLKHTSWSAALQDLPIERKPYPLRSSDTSYSSDDTDDMSELLHPSTISSHTEPDLQQTEQTVRRAEPSSSDTEFEKSEDGPQLEEVTTRVDGGINGQSQDETGRSGDEDVQPGPSGWQPRNRRKSKIVSYRETRFSNVTGQTIRRAEPSSSDTELEKSEDGPQLEEVATRVDGGINGQSQDETGRSGDEDVKRGPSGWQPRNRRKSKIVSYRETHFSNVSSNDSEGEVVSSDDDDELWNLSKRPKTRLTVRTRRDYTRKEKLAIIKFISKYRYHHTVKGREMWQKAESAQICPNRTWQSMKEHFIKQILPSIETYDLSEEELSKFQNVRK